MTHISGCTVFEEKFLAGELKTVTVAAFSQVLWACNLDISECDVRCVTNGYRIAQDVNVPAVLGRPARRDVLGPNVSRAVDIDEAAGVHVVR